MPDEPIHTATFRCQDSGYAAAQVGCVIGNQVIRLAASEQIPHGFTHQGNRAPASHEPWDAVEPMAQGPKYQGMKGIFAIDVAVVQAQRGLRFPAIECNPGCNGATYPSMIAQKLDIPEWSAVACDAQGNLAAALS